MLKGPTVQCPYFWNSQSLLSSGQTCLVLSHLEMQWKWKAWLHMPHATVHSSEVADAWFAWHSMQRSMMWLRQMAQLSTTMSHAQSATAFHFFTSNLFETKKGMKTRHFSTYPGKHVWFCTNSPLFLLAGARGWGHLLVKVDLHCRIGVRLLR